MSEPYTCESTVEFQKWAEEVLNETEKTRQEGLDELKSWIRANPQIHARDEDKYILPFLRASKFDLEKAKEKIRTFYTMKRDRTEWFGNRDPYSSDVQELVKLGCVVVLPKSHENLVVAIVRPNLRDPNRYTLDHIFKIGSMIADITLLENEIFQIYGTIIIVDMTNIGFGHLRQLSAFSAKRIVRGFLQYPIRPQAIYLINTPVYINMILKMFKVFLTAKLKKRINILSDNNLTGIINKRTLPRDYDGEEISMEELSNYWMDKLISNTEWFLEDQNYKAE